jgi:hypothetical protein
MHKVKEAYADILDCKECNGHGFTGYADKAGNYDFEYCICNPHHLPDPKQIA